MMRRRRHEPEQASAERVRLAAQFSMIKAELITCQVLLAADGEERLAAAFDTLVDAARRTAGQEAHEAWEATPITTDAEMNMGALFNRMGVWVFKSRSQRAGLRPRPRRDDDHATGARVAGSRVESGLRELDQDDRARVGCQNSIATRPLSPRAAQRSSDAMMLPSWWYAPRSRLTPRPTAAPSGVPSSWGFPSRSTYAGRWTAISASPPSEPIRAKSSRCSTRAGPMSPARRTGMLTPRSTASRDPPIGDDVRRHLGVLCRRGFG